MKPKEKESDIVRAICEYLTIRKCFFWRQNTIPVFSDGKYRAMSKYSMKGVPDIIVVKDGYFIGLEVKRAKTKQSPDQKEFERLCKEAGGEYHVVRSIDDCIEIGL